MSTFTTADDFIHPDKLVSHPQLPNPLIFQNGKSCETVKDWENKRKPELKAHFEHYMYGKRPNSPNNLNGRILYTNENAFNGKVSLKEIELTYNLGEFKNPAPIHLLIATPKGKGPFPCFVGIMFCGNHAIVADEGIRLPTNWQYDRQPGVVDHKATPEGRGKQMNEWPIEKITSQGYALAVFYAGDIQPDRPDVDEAFRKTLKNQTTATIMSWSWGISRVADYLEAVKEIDSQKLAVVGHSRLGKTALLTGAFDERFKVMIPNQAGCGGTGPSRHNDPKAETVKRINTNFPHWFSGNFKLFNDDTTKLPFDQNGLVALCAPRAVLFTNAAEDLWANPSGQFNVLKAGEPAYKLYGVEGCAASTMPKENELVDSRLGYFIRPGKHAMTTADWDQYLKFADRWLKK